MQIKRLNNGKFLGTLGSGNWFLPWQQKKLVHQVEQLAAKYFHPWANVEISLSNSKQATRYSDYMSATGRNRIRELSINIPPLLFLTPEEIPKEFYERDLAIYRFLRKYPQMLSRVREFFILNQVKALKKEQEDRQKILKSQPLYSYSSYGKDASASVSARAPFPLFKDNFDKPVYLSNLLAPFRDWGAISLLCLPFVPIASVIIIWLGLLFTCLNIKRIIREGKDRGDKLFKEDAKLLEISGDIEAIELLFKAYEYARNQKYSPEERRIEKILQPQLDPRNRFARIKALAQKKNIQYSPETQQGYFLYKKEALLVGILGVYGIALGYSFLPGILDSMRGMRDSFVDSWWPEEKLAQCISSSAFPQNVEDALSIFRCNHAFKSSFAKEDFPCKIYDLAKRAFKEMEQVLPSSKEKALFHLDQAYELLKEHYCKVKDTLEGCVSHCPPEKTDDFVRIAQCFPKLQKQFSSQSSVEDMCKQARSLGRELSQFNLLKVDEVIARLNKFVEESCLLEWLKPNDLEECVLEEDLPNVLGCYDPYFKKWSGCKTVSKIFRKMSVLLHPDHLEGREEAFKKLVEAKEFYRC